MRALLACCFLLLGCGAAAPQAPRTGLVPKSGTAAVPVVRTDLIGFGLSAEFPGVPVTSTGRDKDLTTVTVGLESAPYYQLTAVSTRGGDRPNDADWYEALRKKLNLKKRRDVRLAGFLGVELSGSHEKKPLISRLLAVGDTLFVMEVVGKPGGTLDEARALQFLDSVQLELPWRIYASPTTKLSVMVPSHAIEIDKTQATNDGRSNSRAFFMGGEGQLTYWVTGEELTERNPEVTDDQLLDGAMNGMQNGGVEITWQGPIQAAGVRGREFLAIEKNTYLMGRVLLSDHFVYLLFISAASRDALKAAESSKFYGSFVAY